MAAFIATLYSVILKPLILLMFGIAIVVFFWDMVQCMQDAEDPGERGRCIAAAFEKIVGFAIMIGAVAIVAVLANTVGVRNNITLPQPVAPSGVVNPLDN